MKWIVLGILLFIGYMTPVYMFSHTVLPQIQSLQRVYANADTIAGAAAGERATTCPVYTTVSICPK